jgi:hypothetical protein
MVPSFERYSAKSSQHDVSDTQFNGITEALYSAGIRVACLGSNIGNWDTSIDELFAETGRNLERSMSYAVDVE